MNDLQDAFSTRPRRDNFTATTACGTKLSGFSHSGIRAGGDWTVYACDGVLVVAEHASTVYAADGSKVIAKRGSLVIAEEGSEATAEEGSDVFADYGSKVTAMSGSMISAMAGSTVHAEAGAKIQFKEGGAIIVPLSTQGSLGTTGGVLWLGQKLAELCSATTLQ